MTSRRNLVAIALSSAGALMSVGCGDGAKGTGDSTVPTVRSTESTAPPVGSIDPTFALLADLSSGCPASLPVRTTAGAWDTFIDNRDQTGLADQLVPGVPTAVLVCRYTSIFTPTDNGSYVRGADLLSETTFDGDTATELADLANAAPYTPNSGHGGCIVFINAADRFTGIVFVEPGRDINLWYDDTGDNRSGRNSCNTLSNGQRYVTDDLVGFLEKLDAIAPRAPVVCRAVGSSVPSSTYDDGSALCL